MAISISKQTSNEYYGRYIGAFYHDNNQVDFLTKNAYKSNKSFNVNYILIKMLKYMKKKLIKLKEK